ncbi:MAG: type II toxin-antitoxin system VapC family toxin [Bryobacteraceae bacterium]
MVIDTSAAIAILLQEPDARAFAQAIERDPVRMISSVNWLETRMVMAGRFGPQGALLAESFFRESQMELTGLDPMHAQAAYDAWLRFGKGRHPASLNLGDCCAYATARIEQQPLLCKGGDFAQTDAAIVDIEQS